MLLQEAFGDCGAHGKRERGHQKEDRWGERGGEQTENLDGKVVLTDKEGGRACGVVERDEVEAAVVLLARLGVDRVVAHERLAHAARHAVRAHPQLQRERRVARKARVRRRRVRHGRRLAKVELVRVAVRVAARLPRARGVWHSLSTPARHPEQ